MIKKKLVPAMMVIEDKLLETGMSQEEIDYLMSRFLEEEAQTYVECMKLVEEECKKKIVLH